MRKSIFIVSILASFVLFFLVLGGFLRYNRKNQGLTAAAEMAQPC